MSTDFAGRFQQKIAGIGADGRCRSLAGSERPQARYHAPDTGSCRTRVGVIARWMADAGSDAGSRLPQLTNQTVRRVAAYVAGGLVAGGVMLAASNVGSERHTWWGWLLIGASMGWLSFLGLVVVTFVALRVVVGALRWSLWLTSRMSVPARVGAFVVVVGATAGTLFARVCPNRGGVPVESTFSLLSPRRHHV